MKYHHPCGIDVNPRVGVHAICRNFDPHTNLYLTFRSITQALIVPCLKHRAKKFCSEETELGLLSKVFVANGYQQKEVRELMNKEDKKIKKDPSVNDSEVEGKGNYY